MVELNVCTYDFERIGTIEYYKSLSIERNYYNRSMLELELDATEQNVNLLQIHRILTTRTNPNYAYIITHFEYTDGEDEELIKVIAFSLNHLFNYRTIIQQERRVGNVETILKQFIANQCITPTNSRRVIPNLILAPNSGINTTTESTVTGMNLEEFIWEFCQKYEMTVDVLMNHDTKKYEVYTWHGQNLSEGVAKNSVKFSKEFENVNSIEFVHDESEYRNVAYVAGEGEGEAREVVEVSDDSSGLLRKEIFIDARDLQSEYKDTNDNDVILTPAQYRQLLRERGLEKISEMNIIETFQGEIIETQFQYGVDYSLGDIISFKSEKLNRILHTRATSSEMKVDENGKVTQTVSFGQKIPDLIDKLKKAVKK